MRSSTRLASLAQPVDAASLGVFRIFFGVAVAVDAWRYLAYGWVTEYYIRPKLNFTYLYLDFIRPLPGDWMLVHYWLISALALLVAAGLYYRISSALLFVAYTYVFLLEQSVYMNHHYLMALLTLLLACMPAANAYSLDNRTSKPSSPKAHKRAEASERRRAVPRWTILLLRFQLAVVYLYGALAKLNVDWLRGEPMYSSLTRHPNQVPAFLAFLPPEMLAYGIAYGGIVADAIIPLLLLGSRTFWLGFSIAFFFHAFNAVTLRIGVFSYLMTGAILIFLPPDWPRRLRPLWRQHREAPIWRRAGGVLVGLTRAQPTEARGGETVSLKPAAAAMIAAYVVVQLLLPLRHFLYPGPVSWTEEGHRFAWHMKLRQKRSIVKITVTDPATGESWQVNQHADLTPRQARKLGVFPDILLQYVHAVRDQLRREGIEPVITVDWQCSLNGRPYQPLVDSTANLAAAERTWRPAKWILPLPD